VNKTNEIGIGLMARAPEVGRVKTRLAATLGDEQATAIYCDLLKNVSAYITHATKKLSDINVSFYWFVEPEAAIELMKKEYPGFDGYLPQVAGDLGQRMKQALATLLEKHKHAALIGADIPDISAEHIAQAYLALKDHDIVFGPTHDGGYYLIGVNSPYDVLFEEIPWSASNTLQKSVAACQRAQLRYDLLEPMGDLDVLEDFRRIRWRPSSVNVEIPE